MENCTIVAEIGNAHLGSLDRAKELARLACLCGADYLKTQKRNPTESVPKKLQDKPHPNKKFAYGKTYLEHRENLELDIDQHVDLAKYCKGIGIRYSTSVWDITSAQQVISKINPGYIKIPSACNNHFKLLDVVFSEYKGGVHISLGMQNSDERSSLFEYLRNDRTRPTRTVLYHCTSEYPCPFEHLYLETISGLMNLSQNYLPFDVGFSNHGYGIAADIAAYILGANWVERHFIDDRTIAHSDAAASLEPDGLRRLCRDVKNVQKAMKVRPKRVPAGEAEQRRKLRWRAE